jgi:NTP pyrophosphatase (non-canonical NTP hydrolase)
MTKLQKQVQEFMEAFQQDCSSVQRMPSQATFDLGMKLITEERNELQGAETLTDRKDAIGDLLYVVYWMANAHGLDMEAITDEIHRSNMSKMWTDEEIAQLIPKTISTRGICARLNASVKVIHSLAIGNPRRHVVVRVSDGKVIKSPSYSPAQLENMTKVCFECEKHPSNCICEE